MKKPSRNLFCSLFIIACLFSSLLCDKTGCKESLADLTSKIAAQVVAIFSGENFDFQHAIGNVLDAASACVTATADTSTSSATIDYFPTPSSSGSNVLNQTNSVPSISPNTEVTENYEVNFSDPGTYMVKLNCNSNHTVKERDYSNNSSSLDASAGRSIYPPDASPEYIGKYKSASIVFIVEKGDKPANHTGVEFRRTGITVH